MPSQDGDEIQTRKRMGTGRGHGGRWLPMAADIMEPPPGSPESSPIKSPCPSTPPQSPVSSVLLSSAASSPLMSVVSSPLQCFSEPSSPLLKTPSPFQSPAPLLKSPSLQSPPTCGGFQNKRPKLNSDQQQENVCCKLFIDNFEGQGGPSSSQEMGGVIEESGGNQTSNQECSNDGILIDFGENIVQEDDVIAEEIEDIHEDGDLIERCSSSSSVSSSSCSSCSSSDECVNSSASSEEEEISEQSETEESEIEDSVSEESSTENDSSESDGEFLSPKVYEGCELTEDEGVLLVMDLFTKFKLSKKQVGGFLKCLLKFIPNVCNFPTTQYKLFQYVERLSPVSAETSHYYCSDCYFYLGTEEIICSLCQGESHKFFHIPLADQIRNLFENHGLADYIDKYNVERSNLDLRDSYSDLLDGSEFKRAHVEGQYNLDLMGHTDGISISESSFVSLWPLEWVIAQLPPYMRFKYVLVNGIWLDESKPYINTMMKPFVKELQAIRENGITWIHPRTKCLQTTYVSVPCFCGDAPVRAMLQNILQHGGTYSCHSCELKMKKLPRQPVLPGQKKLPRRRVYTFEGRPATLRTAQRMEDQGTEARRKQQESNQKLIPVKGVKGPSEVSNFPGCDLSTAVFPEYMHLIMCLLKEFMTLWFENDGPWSLKGHRETINQFLKSISVPDYITRIPRSTEHFSKWKANEYRSFLLFFSLIILSKVMKKEYFQHWMLLVYAIYLLLQDSVSENDVNKADILLSLFCRSFAVLYKHESYTYYVHQLRHLALTVRRHGPLHCNSAFMFESFNGTLAKYIHGSKNQGQELVNNIKIAFGVGALRARSLLSTTAKNQLVEFRNKIKDINISEVDLELLRSCIPVKEPLSFFYRAIIRHETFTCSLYKRQRKRNNFTIMFMSSSNNKVYGQIKYFCQSDNDQVALVEKFDVDHLNTFCHDDSGVVIKHIIPIVPTGLIEVIKLSAIICKVIRVENYVCLRPNIHEYNL